MRLLLGKYCFFGSYAALEFDYADLGLSLISGPTGAGKSTVFDAPTWCLFGVTSKEGAVDEVRAWGTDQVTSGEQQVELPGGVITVVRVRGSAKQNDLYWIEPSGEKRRGKDVKETQDLLEGRLGVSAELYILSSYFSQFSRGDVFFTSRPKDRRDTLERIADLSLPINIMEGASAQRKSAKSEAEATAGRLARVEGQIATLEKAIQAAKHDAAEWEAERAVELTALRRSAQEFHSERADSLTQAAERMEELDAKIVDNDSLSDALRSLDEKDARLRSLLEEIRETEKLASGRQAQKRELEKALSRLASLGPVCPTCLGPSRNTAREAEMGTMRTAVEGLQKMLDRDNKAIETLNNSLAAAPTLATRRGEITKQILDNQQRISEFDKWRERYLILEKATNTYEKQSAKLEAAVNPHAKRQSDASEEYSLAGICAAKLKQEIEEQEHRVAQLNLLYDLSFALRGQLLQNAVQEIQAETNRIIEKYFEGEIQVDFSLDADKLEVSIQKSGYECSFRQLSGGQRRILTLSFAVALMGAAANKAGVQFENLFFDEALNGLDDGLKVKAFGLFEELSTRHGTVMLIEHTEEIKGLFSRRYAVKLEADCSEIEAIE